MPDDVQRILVAGTINTDLVVRTRKAPEAGETVTGTSFAIFGGGKGANQAVAAARAGGIVAMLSGTADDDFGRQRRADLAAENVSTESVITTDRAASGVALITVEDSGQNRIAYVPGAGWEVRPEDAIDALDRWRPSYVLSTLELPEETLSALLETARERRIQIICNATPEPSEHVDLVRMADILVVNETEAIEMVPAVSDAPWSEVAGELAELGPGTVILTLGSEGALVFQPGRSQEIPAIPVKVVDTTGAGDAFCGSFTAFLADGKDVFDAAALAVVAASLSVERVGAQPSIPTLAEIKEAFDRRRT